MIDIIEIPECRRDPKDGQLILGMFFCDSTTRIVLYEGSIIAEAKATGSDLKDMKELTLLHETAHSLQDLAGLVPAKSVGSSVVLEKEADEWAWRAFIQRHGRKPNVNDWR